jgi:hypothetical protein
LYGGPCREVPLQQVAGPFVKKVTDLGFGIFKLIEARKKT